MIVNVNPQKPEDDNEIKIEVKDVNVSGVIIMIIFALGMIALSVFGMSGGLEAESGDSSGFIILMAMGVVFLLVGIAFLMAYYKFKSQWIQLVIGIALTILGFMVPIFSFGAGCFFIIFGLIGLYLVIKSINTIRGKHEENQELDDQVNSMVTDAVKKLADTDDEYKSSEPEYGNTDQLTEEEVVSAVQNIGKGIGIIHTIITCSIFCFIAFIAMIIGIVWMSVGIGYDKVIGIGLILFGLIVMIACVIGIVKIIRKK